MSPTDDFGEGGTDVSETLRPFASFHPAVALAAGTALLLFAMFALQPVYVCLSLVSAFVLSGILRGWTRTLAKLRWQLGLVLLMACVNALFAGYGATTLCVLGPFTIKLESLVYGAMMGAVFVSVMLWCENLSSMVNEDEIMQMLGTKAPATATTLAIAAQLVPQSMRRYRAVKDVHLATTAARQPSSAKERTDILAGGILLSWMLEDSIGRADAMRARGWARGQKRSAFQTHEFHARDAVALIGLAALGLASAVPAGMAVGQWHFYPTMPTLVFWWGYVPYMMLAALPIGSLVHERMLWRKEER